MKKRNVASILAHGPGPEVERLLRLRQEGGLASAAKLGTLLAGEENGRLYDTLIYHKSTTGRWAGSGFQPQNLRRDGPRDETAAIDAVLSGDLDRVAVLGAPIDLIASLSRSLIIGTPSCDLISGDFSAIESRITGWFADEEWKLANYSQFDRTQAPELEPYCAVGSRVLGRQITPDDEEGRQLGKLLGLAFGFGGGVGAFTKIAPDAGFSAEQIDQFKRSYRAAHPATVRFWNRLFGMLKRTVRTGETLTLGKVGAEMRDGNLLMRLPSERAITYPAARIAEGKYSEEIAFRDNAKGWQETSEWAGTFVENLVQGTARDLLVAAMHRVEAAGYKIVLTVHDELVAEVDEGFCSAEEFRRIIEPPAWAAGLPFAAKVSRRKRFSKPKKVTTTPVPGPIIEPATDAGIVTLPAAITPSIAPALGSPVLLIVPDAATMLAAALDCAARGWPCFPLKASGERASEKSAVRSNGQRWGATLDPGEIRCDRDRWPANGCRERHLGARYRQP
jgi:DNA polymerase